jgi:malonyl-CoA O-methyltransferase
MAAPTDSSAPRAFDERAVARSLRRHAEAPWLHREVAQRMAQRLAIIKTQPQRVLDWWAQIGGSEESLAAAYPKVERISVEPAQTWQAAPERPWWARWRSQAAPLRDDAVPDASAQLLWANMMLHAVADPQALFTRWHRALAIDGFVMFSTLGPDTLRELRALYARLGWPPPMAELVDMHDLGDMLVHAGFADPVMDQEPLTLTWATPQALLEELRTLGGNAHPQRFAALRTPRWRERLHAALRETAGADGRIAMRFELVYGHAFKPTPRVRVAEEATVSLQDMKAMVRSGSKRQP